ncbi:MAG TPA: PRC-barrel domain-containing protein [Streptosporangiaceae bacterium]
MATTALFTIGAEVSCVDGVCGEVRRVIVDPVAEAVTHIVVEPENREGEGRLVPLGIVDATTGEIRLRCTMAEFENLDRAEETQFIQGTGEFAGYTPAQVRYLPYYGLGGGIGLGMGAGMAMSPAMADSIPPRTIIRDTVPPGEVEIRRGEPVQATDGDIGKVQGLVIDPGSRHITHVLLQQGHLWGRKEVAIPVSAVADTSDGIQLTISKQDVQDLPPVDIDHRV